MGKFKNIFWFAPKSKIKAGEGLDKGRFPFYTSSAIQSKWIDTEQHFDEALIFGTGGSASIHYESQPFSTSTDCFVTITTRKDVNTKYVYYFLSSNIHLIERGFKGAGLKHLSKKFLEEIEIPLPDLETQNKIVAILDKAKAILDKREETIMKYDELLRATFLEMFGDPILNPLSWEKNAISNYTDCIVPGRDKPKSFTGNVPWLTTEDLLKNGFVSYSNKKMGLTELEIKQVRAKIIPKGSIIMTCVGDLGVCSINIEECVVNQQLHTYQCNSEMNNIFLMMQLDFFKEYLYTVASITTVPYMNKTICNSIPVIKPNIELQERFARYYILINKIKNGLYEFKGIQTTLLNSLSQLAFSGKLDFNTAVDLEVLLENDFQFFKENSNSGSIRLLIERLNTDARNDNRFYEQQTYDKAKSFVFELIKEGKVKQVFDEKTKKVKLTV